MSNLSPAAILYDSSGTEKGTGTNPVSVSNITKVSTLNTTTTPLGANATFTGSWEDVTPYGFMNVDAYANVASADGGWLLQWSFDGANLDTSDALSLPASAGRSLALPVRSRYFRMVYTNGATPQGTFRLNVIYRENGSPVNTHAVTWPVSATTLAQMTRSVIVGESSSGGGSYHNVKVTPSGALAAEVTDGGGSITVDGTVTANLGTIDGVATETTLSAINTKVPALGQAAMAGSVPVTMAGNQPPISVTGTLTATTQALIAKQDPSYTVGTNQPLSMYPDGYLRTRIEMHAEATDAFGRIRTSHPVTLFDGKPLYGDRTTEFVEALTGSATSTLQTNAPIKTLAIAAGVTGSAIRQTRWYMGYQAGKSQQILVTFDMSVSPGSGAGNHRVGYFDASNGLFLEKNNDVLYMVKRTSTSGSPVDTAVAQSSWNIDPMNGTGPSGLTLNSTNAQILYIDFEWLGVGSARMGFVINGAIHYVHVFHWANLNSGVYMATPSLPVRWEINKTSATATAVFLDAICCSVASEGGNPRSGWDTAVDRGTSLQPFVVGDGTTLKPIISVRAKTAYTRMTTYPTDIHCICTTSSSSGYRWVLLLNPTIGGTGPTWVSAGTNSGLEYDITRTGVVTGGVPVASGYGAAANVSGMVGNILPLGADVAGTRDEYVLAVQQFVAAAESYTGGLIMREIY